MTDQPRGSAATEKYVVTSTLRIDATSPEEASEKATAMWQRRDVGEIKAASGSELRDALAMYADPDSYFAIAVLPDRPSGAFADDFGCVIGPHGDHDHRHGRAARRALGDEWWGTEPCDDMKKLIAREAEDDD